MTPPASLLDRRDVRRPDRLLVAASAAGGSRAARRSRRRTRSARTGSGRPGGRRRPPAARATISAYDVSSISRALRAEVGQRHAPDLGVVLGRHHDRQAGRDRAVAPGELGLVLRVRHLVACRPRGPLGWCPADQTAPRVRVAQEQVAAPRIARDVLTPAGDRDVAASGCSRSRRSSPSRRSARSTAGASAGSCRGAR